MVKDMSYGDGGGEGIWLDLRMGCDGEGDKLLSPCHSHVAAAASNRTFESISVTHRQL